jgi:hypothetical protein
MQSQRPFVKSCLSVRRHQPPAGPRNSNSIPINADIRNATSCPFQDFDCHIKNHSPPTLRNTTSHINKPTVNPAIAHYFADSNATAVPCNARPNFAAPQEHSTVVAVSQAMIDR